MIPCRKLCRYFVEKNGEPLYISVCIYSLHFWHASNLLRICASIHMGLPTSIELEQHSVLSHLYISFIWYPTYIAIYFNILRMQWKQNTVFEFIAKVSVRFSIMRKVKYTLYYILKCVVLHCIAYLMMIITIGIHFQIII